MKSEAKRRLVVGISGASGVILAIRLLEALRATDIETHLVLSPAARTTIAAETDWELSAVKDLADVTYRFSDIGAAIASGSFETLGMVVIPCSIKTSIRHRQLLLRRSADTGRRCDPERRPPAGAGRPRSAAPLRAPAPDDPGGPGWGR